MRFVVIYEMLTFFPRMEELRAHCYSGPDRTGTTNGFICAV
jgi:hypothetical protein